MMKAFVESILYSDDDCGTVSSREIVSLKWSGSK